MSKQRTGLLVINTGDGKGKATAAIGTAFRALGHGMRVAVIQFIKGKWQTGERKLGEQTHTPLAAPARTVPRLHPSALCPSWQKTFDRRTFAPAQPTYPAASLRDFLTGALTDSRLPLQIKDASILVRVRIGARAYIERRKSGDKP